MSDVITILVGVLIAGALGTALRVLVADPDAVFSRQVMGTLVVNVVGSFALGVISALDGNTALIIGVGGLGAFTTFSTFISQVEQLNREAKGEQAFAYVLASVILGVSAALLGLAIT